MSTVLIVDDDSSVRFILSEFLINNGFDPMEAHNGDAALEIYRKARPALVLLDLKMPGMDGMECMRELKRIDPEAAIIILAGYGDVTTAVSMTRLGAYDFILKPPDFDRLLATVRNAILLSQGDILEEGSIQLSPGEWGLETGASRATPLKDAQSDSEEKAIRQALDLAEGNRTRAARALGISLSSLRRKMKKHNIL